MRRKMKAILTVLLVLIVTGFCLSFLPAQDQPDQQQNQDQQGQPDQSVGRVSVLNGGLSTLRGDSGDWVADTINTPVVPGDQLSTGTQSRTEIQLDYANVLRMSGDTQVKVANLSQSGIQLQVGQGLVDYAVIRDNQENIEIDTPNLAIHPVGRGTYRIQVDSPTETLVTVRQGEVQVSTSEGSTNVKKGETITVQGSENPEYKIEEAQGRDDWDHWNEDRDKSILEAQSWQHTDPYYTGSSDLDQYGHWVYVPGYNYVWQPSVAPGWAPYSDGSWEWEPYWGWTWVSGEPWGWAPYHYGRWFMWNDAWAWWPGPIGDFGFGLGWYRPIWAPAYVSFFGFGGGGFGLGFGLGFGFGGGFGFGSIGWLPIGPCDSFFPWWGHGRGFNAVNFNNIRNINNFNNFRNLRGAMPPLSGRNDPAFSNLRQAFTNQRMRQSITSVAGNRFGQGPVRGARQPVSAQMLRGSSLVSGRLPVVPTRASLSPTTRAPAANTIRRAGSMPSHFAGTQSRVPAGRSFAQEAGGVRQMVQGLNARTVDQQGRTAAEQLNRMPAGNRTPEITGNVRQQPGNGANRSFAGQNPSVAGRNMPQAGSRQATAPGWQQFQSQGAARGAAPGYSNAAPASRGFNQAGRPAPQSGQAGQTAQQGWQRFANRGTASGHSNATPGSRGFSQGRPAPPAGTSQQGWQRFASHGAAPGYSNAAPASRGFNQAQPAPQAGASQPGWARFSQQGAAARPGFAPRSAPGASRGSWNSGYGGASRPPLQMSRPMFTPRSSPGYGGSSGWGGGRSSGDSFGGYGGRSGGSSGYSGRSFGGFGGGRSGGNGGGHSFGGGGRSGGFSGGGHSGGGSRGGGGGHR